jgi:sugar-specific transcriptional regulator TrmB/DNA-binding CsgD family transcriptional regulator
VSDDVLVAFGVIGIGPEAERVYDVLVDGRPASAAELVEATGMTRDQVREAIRVLTESRIAERLPGAPPSYVAADPSIALDVLLLAAEQEVKKARIRAQELAGRYRLAAGKREPAELVEIVSGRQAAFERVQQVQRAIRRTLRCFDKAPYAANMVGYNEIEADLLRRGGVSQVIYERTAAEAPGRVADLEWGISLGEQARVLPHLPTKLILVDDTLAILPLQAAPEAIESIVVVHKSALLEAIIALFETLWEIAIPLRLPTADAQPTGQPDGQPTGQPNAEERRILALLAVGIPDEVIARELGLSDRTYQRRLHGLMQQLNAQTRFQLGRLASRCGWLDEDAPGPRLALLIQRLSAILGEIKKRCTWPAPGGPGESHSSTQQRNRSRSHLHNNLFLLRAWHTHDPGLVRVQLQPDLGHPLFQGGEHLAGLLLCRAVHHRVVGVALELDGRELAFQPRVERVGRPLSYRGLRCAKTSTHRLSPNIKYHPMRLVAYVGRRGAVATCSIKGHDLREPRFR